MLELLVAIALNTLKQGSEGKLLLMAELGLLFLNHGLHLHSE